MIVEITFESQQEKVTFMQTGIAKELMQTDFSKLNPFFRRILFLRLFLLPPVALPVHISIDGEEVGT